MTDYKLRYIKGQKGELACYIWPVQEPRFLALLLHGYGEHLGRYHHVAAALNAIGGYVFGPDHQGHGLSQGERVLIEDFEDVNLDVNQVVQTLRAQRPELPLVVIGHSMGGMIAARYVQRHPGSVNALVLSGPLLGVRTQIGEMASLTEIPETPLDITKLSRDPAVGDAYQQDKLVWHGPFKRPTVQAIREHLLRIDRSRRLGQIPLLWMHGEDDAIVPLTETEAGIERLRGSHFGRKIWPGARHEIFNETNQQQVLKHMTNFISRSLHLG